jgi:hypothetical protein
MRVIPLFRNCLNPAAGLFQAALIALAASVAAPGAVAADPVLKVTALGQSAAFTAQEFSALPHTEVAAFNPHEKKDHRYSGVPVHDLLARVGVPFGEKLRGAALRLAVMVHSKDGYATLFAVAEFDELLSSRTILLVDAMDGAPLPPNLGPLYVVAPGDKRAARWARMVTSIEVVQVPASGP